MTLKTWIAPPEGPRISYAWQNVHNWSPLGAPQPGDTDRMAAGVMNIFQSSLPGELRLGPAPNQPETARITLNFTNGEATIGIRGNSTLLNYGGLTTDFSGPQLTINANGLDQINADNLSAVEGTVNIGANSDLVVTGKMTFGYAGHLEGATNGPGTRGLLTNHGDISISNGDISARVNGHGTIELHNYHDGTGKQVISGAIGANQNVVLVAHDHPTVTELVHPETFKASLQIADERSVIGSPSVSYLELDGVHASRMDIQGDMLRLLGPRGGVVWQDHLQLPSGYTAAMFDTKSGTQIEFGTAFIPHPLAS